MKMTKSRRERISPALALLMMVLQQKAKQRKRKRRARRKALHCLPGISESTATTHERWSHWEILAIKGPHCCDDQMAVILNLIGGEEHHHVAATIMNTLTGVDHVVVNLPSSEALTSSHTRTSSLIVGGLSIASLMVLTLTKLGQRSMAVNHGMTGLGVPGIRIYRLLLDATVGGGGRGGRGFRNVSPSGYAHGRANGKHREFSPPPYGCGGGFHDFLPPPSQMRDGQPLIERGLDGAMIRNDPNLVPRAGAGDGAKVRIGSVY